MGIDQLVTGGDVDDPVVDSLTSDSVNTGEALIGGRPPSIGWAQGDSLVTYEGELVTASPNSYETIFDLSNSTRVLWGSIFGPYATDLRVTRGDGTTETITSATSIAGNVNDGSTFLTSIVVPTIPDVKKLEWYSRSNDESDYGYLVVTQ